MRAGVVAFAALLGGCVLLIDPIETNDHCGIQGASECADCIRTSCTAEIDACCASNECAGTTVLSDMDACGRGEVDACYATLAAGRVTKSEEAVRFCAAGNCRAACTVGASSTGNAPRPKWTCNTAREPVNDCATCIFDSCGTKLDSCCADSSCSGDTTIQLDLGACISGDQKACAYSQIARSTSGQPGVVRACILEKCAAKCLGNGLTHTDCTLYNGGKYCQCVPSETAGDQTCLEKDIEGADCIEANKGCACGVYGCNQVSSGCECAFTGGGVGQSCQAKAGSSSSSSGFSNEPVCCLKLSETLATCDCLEYKTSCYSDEYPVESCDRLTVIAALSNRVTKACSR